MSSHDRENTSNRSRLHGFVDQQVSRHVPDAPPGAQRGLLPLLRSETPKEERQVPPFVPDQSPAIVHAFITYPISCPHATGCARAVSRGQPSNGQEDRRPRHITRQLIQELGVGNKSGEERGQQ